MSRFRRLLRPLIFLAVGLGVSGMAIAVYYWDPLSTQELDTVDWRFERRGTIEVPRDLVVVEIDDDTFSDLDAQWPFRREWHGKVVDRIAKDDAKVIAYDVQFTEASQYGEEDDFALAEAAGKAKNVVFSTTEVDEGGGTAVLGGDENLKAFSARVGNGLLPNDPGGVLRRLAHEVDQLESFALVAAEVASGEAIGEETLGGETAWIDYHGPPGTIETITFSSVLCSEDRSLCQDDVPEVPEGFFKDKLVVVGPSAPSLQDIHPTSTSGDDQMAGAEIQANALSTARRDFPLEEAPQILDLALIVLLALAVPASIVPLSGRLAGRRSTFVAALFSTGITALVTVVTGVLFALLAVALFNGGTIVNMVYPLMALVLGAAGALIVQYTTAAFERERVRDLFSRFVPESVVDDVLDSAAAGSGGLRLAGIQREGTVMFTDLRGFTSFAESLPVDQVLEVLNQYLEGMSDAILNHGGTLVAYMGDGIMAVFGAPIEQPDHADRALDTAREMLFEKLPRFNDYLRERDLGEGFRMGIGLNTGPVMSGHVGSERRLEYTALGDTTNTSARLEGMTKGTPHQLFMAESTVEALAEKPEDAIFVDEFEVRGRQAKIRIWSIDEERSRAEWEAASASASAS